MTEEIQVLPARIEGTLPSADGKNVLVKIHAGESDTVLAFDLDQAFTVISGVASAAEKCRLAQGLERSATYAMNVQEWSLGLNEAGQMIVMFDVLGGIALSFGVDTSQIAPMREALQAMEAALDKPQGAQAE